MSSLNPAFTVGEQIAEVVRRHRGASRKDAWKRAVEMLDRVHIATADRRAHDYPHQFSGGMRQRVMIAMAIACDPKLLIADEPSTALDVTIQAQILDLIQSLRVKYGLSLLLITHSLGVVAEVTDRVRAEAEGAIVKAINQAEEGWEKTLTGVPKEIYEFWKRQLQPRGYHIRYEVVDYPNGMPGDIGIVIAWGA